MGRFWNISNHDEEELEDAGDQSDAELHPPEGYVLPFLKRCRALADSVTIGEDDAHGEGHQHSQNYGNLRVDTESRAQLLWSQLGYIGRHEGHEQTGDNALAEPEDVEGLNIPDLKQSGDKQVEQIEDDQEGSK